MRKACETRFLFALIAAVSFVSLMPTDARAQFTTPCPATATDITCTNSIDVTGTGVFQQTDAGSVNITLQNLPTGLTDGMRAITTDGNALTQNQGQAGGMFSIATGLGNATATNLPFGLTGIMQAVSQSGVALSQNAGTVATGMQAISQNAGTAISINTGVTDYIYTYTPNGGDATTFNSGTVANALNAISTPGSLPPFPPAIFTFAEGATGNATAINTGTVNASGGPFSLGLLTVSDGGNAAATNYGSVGGIYTVSGYNGGNGNASAINYGTVTNGGIIAESGYDGGSGNAFAFNAGRVYGGVAARADDTGTATVTNAGLVDGTTSSNQIAISLAQSLYFFPFNPNPFIQTTLNILPGSRIIGFIDLNGDSFFPGTGTTVNIFAGRDISSALTFGGGCGCFNNLIDTGSVVNVYGGAPFVINGNTVAVLDPTSFAMQDKNIADFSHTISSMVTGRLNNPAPMSGGSTAIGFAPSGNVAVDMARDAFAGISSLNYASNDRVLFSNPSVTAKDGTSVWAQGFVGQRIQDADAPTLRSVNNFYGGTLGVDKTFRPGLRLGGLLGAGSISSTVDLNSGDTKSGIVFGGVYGRYAMNQSFVDFALLGGHSRNDLRRNMTNNLVPGGLETASASYNGWFISPEFAYGVKMPVGTNLTLTPTARVRYLAAEFGGYQETGSTTNLTVASRTSHNFEERAEVTLTRTFDPLPRERMHISGTFGLLALQRLGDTTVNTVLLGQNLPFAAPGKNDVFGGYGGVGFDWRHISGWTVFGATEYTATTDSSRTVTAKGGVKVAF